MAQPSPSTSHRRGRSRWREDLIDRTTGEILADAGEEQAGRTSRWQLQGAAARLLPDERVALCMRTMREGDVRVMQSSRHGSTHYAGLATCGSVWHCPVCSLKVGERRREDLQRLLVAAQAENATPLLLTRTFPHARRDDLHALRTAQRAAEKRYKGSRAYRRLREEIGLIGAVRALEITWGPENGWHPHVHELLIVQRPPAAIPELRRALYRLWRRACELSGLGTPSYEHGLDLRGAQAAAQYVTKWAAPEELTRANTKAGRGTRFSPWDLLRAYLEHHDARAGALWSEYARVFKGQRQLVWSAGLARRYGIRDLSDEQLAELEESPAVELGSLSPAEWRGILQSDARAHVLFLAERAGWTAVEAFVRALPPARHHRPAPASPPNGYGPGPELHGAHLVTHPRATYTPNTGG